jgi:DNA-binding protein H-NS
MPTYAEYQKQIAELTRQAEGMRRAEIASVTADIRAKMQHYGLTLSDIGSPGKKPSLKGSHVAPKYVNPATGQAWSGRGMMPRWMADAIAAGKTRESFLILND